MAEVEHLKLSDTNNEVEHMKLSDTNNEVEHMKLSDINNDIKKPEDSLNDKKSEDSLYSKDSLYRLEMLLLKNEGLAKIHLSTFV